MSGSDRSGAEGLAPVTDLFGATPRRSSRNAPGSHDAAGADGAADAAGAGAGSVTGWVPPVVSIADGARLGAGAVASPHDEPSDGASARSRDDQLAEAEKTSMRTLGRRGVSTQELRTALRRHELDDDVVEHEVDRLTRVGLLDDAQLAADLADRLQDRKGLGHQGVVGELRRRGINPNVIDAVLAERDDDDDAAETERATDLATKRAGQMRGLDRETAERRLSGFLMRKGYSGSIVRSAVRTALDGRPAARGTVRFE